MSVETLHAAEHAAGLAIGLSEAVMQDIAESQRPRIVDLGYVPVQTEHYGLQTFRAVRAIAGPDNIAMDKGGTRLRVCDIDAEARALGADMYSKLQLGLTDIDGNPIKGGKTVINADRNILTGSDTMQLFYNLGGIMLGAGIAGHNKSVPAGDMGTNNPLYMKRFAHAVKASGDPYWQASITGKPDEAGEGGLEFRPHATGYGVYLAAVELRKMLEIDGPTRITISGAGNVGGYFGHYASQDSENQFSIRGYSDQGGTLAVMNNDPQYGIKVDDELMKIMDNPSFSGDKLEAIAAVLAERQPELTLRLTRDSRDIMTVPTDIFCPASVRGLINDKAARSLAAAGIVEAGNDTITEPAAKALAERGVRVIPGAAANIGGVDISLREHGYNISAVRSGAEKPTFDDTKKMLEDSTKERFTAIHDMAEKLGTTDLELACNGLIVARKAQLVGYSAFDLTA